MATQQAWDDFKIVKSVLEQSLADTHYKWTAAAIVEAYNKLLALRTYLINQGM